MTRDPVDFFYIAPEHIAIHERLTNWALWGKSGGRGGSVLPMFQGYRDGYHVAQGGGTPVDSLDAVALQKLFIHLPEVNRWAISWAYLYPFVPVWKVCKVWGVQRTELCERVTKGRTMLKNTALREEKNCVRLAQT